MILYRKATEEDIAQLVAFRIEFLKEVQNNRHLGDEEALRSALYDFFNESIRDEEFIAWLAVENDEIVATSGINGINVPPSFSNLTGKVAYISNMYTLPAYRRQGIASALIERLLGEAEERGVKVINLHATPAGKAVYEKFGFTDVRSEMRLNSA